MLRVFHIPSHLTYAAKISSPRFGPVSASAGGTLPVAGLNAAPDWDFFDLIHVHTVELASARDLSELLSRIRRTGKHLVFTIHDLAPNIEADHAAFREKTHMLAERAHRVVTLTRHAADTIASSCGREAAVIPHGYALRPDIARNARRSRPGHPTRLAAFGALRPNRHLLALARAWSRLPPGRPRLDITLRSVSDSDRSRDHAALTELADLTALHHDLQVTTTGRMLPDPDLVRALTPATTLVLPYQPITHSGQLELARDLGISLVLPDVPTLRAQLTETGAAAYPCRWFPAHGTDDPAILAQALADAPAAPTRQWLPERSREHKRLLAAYAIEYCFR